MSGSPVSWKRSSERRALNGKAALCRWARMNQARERNSEDTQLGGLRRSKKDFYLSWMRLPAQITPSMWLKIICTSVKYSASVRAGTTQLV